MCAPLVVGEPDERIERRLRSDPLPNASSSCCSVRGFTRSRPAVRRGSPALLTQTSTGPSAASASSSAPSTDGAVADVGALRPHRRRCLPPCASAALRSTSRTATFAPSAQGGCRSPRRCPEPPPVTTATLPYEIVSRKIVKKRPPHVPRSLAVAQPPVAVDERPASATLSASTSMSIAPACASATTSWSSGSVPQHSACRADHSSGSVPNAIGNVPRRAPTMLHVTADREHAAAAAASRPSHEVEHEAPRRPSPFPRDVTVRVEAPGLRPRGGRAGGRASRGSTATMRAGEIGEGAERRRDRARRRR